MRIVVITGMSGAGKSTALKALEDIGYFCVDNLPFAILPKFLELTKSSQQEVSKIALMIDVRSRDLKENHFSDLKSRATQGDEIEIVFLEASDEVILRRFQATRRRHPWPGNLSITEAIREERKLFGPLKRFADLALDTSDIHVHQLRGMIQERFSKAAEKWDEPCLTLYSFGYSFGIPPDADLVIDVRFLPNPFFIEGLKEHTGESPQVIEYLLAQDKTVSFLKKFYDLLDYLIPLYKDEGKSYLTIAIGCTGGRHRSVMIANQISDYFSKKNIPIQVRHRDISK